MATDSAPDVGGADDALVSARQTDSTLDTLADYCYPLYRRFVQRRRTFVSTVDEKLDEALRDTTVELFLSRAIAIGLIVGVVSWVVGLLLGYLVTVVLVPGVPTLLGLRLSEPLATVVQQVKIPALVFLSGFVFGTLGFASGFGGLVANLYYVADERKREIDHLLSDTVAYMYALSVGGMNQLEILEAVADAEEVYGEVAREFNTIVQETNYFDTDYRTAIRNRAVETPSEPLSQFLTDMLSIVNSGGDLTQFLDDETDKHMQLAKQRQEERLQTLELIGEMYMTVSLLPLLLVILLVIMAMLGNAPQLLLSMTVYVLIPITGVLFLMLISVIKQDEHGDGYLQLDESDTSRSGGSFLDLSTTAAYTDVHRLFELLHRRERRHLVRRLLRNPHELFIERPIYTLAITVPLALLWVVYAAVAGIAPLSIEGATSNSLGVTAVYWFVPLYITMIPLAAFEEWRSRGQTAVLGNLTETLRKLSSANDTGLTLLESFQNVAEASSGTLEDEFDRIHAKVRYGTSLREALIEFNNDYRVPRLARIVKLISEAQETSTQITEVLRTAAQSSENQDELRRNRRTRTQIQIVIIVMTNLTLLAVIAILQLQFISVMAEIVASVGTTQNAPASIASDVNVDRLSMYLFHAVVVQAAVAGLLCGYLEDSRLLSGTKYVVTLSTIAIVVWILIT